ncbi:hypothetical protein ACHAXT_011683 [Thalassiosira profunda]
MVDAKLPITSDLLHRLCEDNHAVVDNFLPQELADRLLDDAERLHSDGQFQQHQFQFGGQRLMKPSVYEMDLSDPSRTSAFGDLGAWEEVVTELGPSFVQQMDEVDRAQPATSSLLSLDTDAPPAIKVQLNSGGGSFPWHYDNPGPPNKRKLTCVIYLNPSWESGDGGEICLWPFLGKRIVIPPLHRRAVFFYSDRVLHRVLPSKVRRVCFTVWCNGTNVNEKKDVMLSKDVLQFTSYDEAQEFFAQSPLQRVISRAVYSDEYLESLLECIVCNYGGKDGGGDEDIPKERRDMLVKQHEASVMGIMTKLRPLIQEFRRRKVALESD